MNNWLKRITGSQQPVIFQNPMQKAQYIMEAMKNPAAFVKEQFPDVPENIRNNPDAILSYLSQTRGSQFAQQVQQVSGMYGRR